MIYVQLIILQKDENVHNNGIGKKKEDRKIETKEIRKQKRYAKKRAGRKTNIDEALELKRVTLTLTAK